MDVIRARHVSIRYITGDFKDIGLKEYFIRKISGKYRVKEFWADRDVTFSIQRGDMLGIVGANGAGKSTLLKAISGSCSPRRGRSRSNGRIAALLELTSGFDAELTVRENTYLRGALLGYSRNSCTIRTTGSSNCGAGGLPGRQFKPALQRHEIAPRLFHRMPGEPGYSDTGRGAQRRRRRIQTKERGPDAPDPAKRVTGVLVSHSLEQVRDMCNKVLWLDHGRQMDLAGRRRFATPMRNS